ncbi:hypothetical protein PGB90_008141 [Kerria lacca]
MEQEKMTISVSELNEALLMEEDEELGPEYRPSTENSAGFQTSPPPISTELATSSNESVKLLEAVKAITTIPDQFMSADKKSLLLMQLFKGETGAQAQLESSTSVTIRTYTDDEKLKTSRNWQKWSRMLELDLEGQKLLQFIHEPRAISLTMSGERRHSLEKVFQYNLSFDYVINCVGETSSKTVIGSVYNYLRETIKVLWNRNPPMNTVYVHNICQVICYVYDYDESLN